MTDRPFWSWSGVTARAFAWLARKKFSRPPSPGMIALVFFYGYTDLFGLKESARFARHMILSQMRKGKANAKSSTGS